MTSRRPKRAAQPSPPTPWSLRPAGRVAERQWNDAVKAQPEIMASVRERLRSRPLDRSDNPNRTHRLHPPLHEFRLEGVNLPQWQHEMTGAGRVWYAVDKGAHTIWVTKVSFDPPRETH